MNRRVLIVSPNFPPISAADMHRARLIAPHLAGEGWDAEILCVEPRSAVGELDPWLRANFPKDIPVHAVGAGGMRMRRMPGLGGVGQRALIPMAREGNRILTYRRHDLVYFSTTMFELHLLGPYWHRVHGVPFAMDYQDAWVSDYYSERPDVVPPGGRAKHAIASFLHRRMEPWVLKSCRGVTAVSPAYIEDLRRRYRYAGQSLVQPFPGAERDFAALTDVADSAVPALIPDDGNIHWVYVGRGGSDMRVSTEALFRAIARHADASLKERLRLHFIGTSYAGRGGQQTILPLAEQHGLGSIVVERSERVPYSTALKCLLAADALIVPGSDDPAYTASKIYPYLLARKPLLAIFREESSVVPLIRSVGGGVCVTFGEAEPQDRIARRIGEGWLVGNAWQRAVPLDRDRFAPHTDIAAAREIAGFFGRCTGEHR